MSIETDTLQAAFDAELQRLAQRGLSPELEVIARRYYSQKERDSMDSSDFCGPHESFPVKSQEDVTNAAHLVGHADNPSAVKACIKGKAKAHGWSLPESWQEEDRTTMAASPSAPAQDGSSPHAVMTGKHAHGHGHMDGYDHEHEHEHLNDNVHDHQHHHSLSRAAAAPPVGSARLYAPIVRIDPQKWEVEGVATSEEVDSFGTIFSYEASKKAFQEWSARSANVREMHDRKAVGKGVNWWPDDEQKRIHVHLRVSRGAPDTWLKVEDGVLSGLSVGATKTKWGTIERNGKTYPYLVDYELAELSLVDNASNPDAQGLVIARAEGLTSLVDTSEPESTLPPVNAVERTGARLSSDSRSALHQMRDQAMGLCSCDECQGMRSAGDKQDDADDMAERVVAAVERALSSVVSRQQSILARFAQIPEQSMQVEFLAFKTDMTATLERVMQASSQDEVRSLLSEVKGQVERIAAQPQVGLAPILNGSRPAEKHLATDFRAQSPANMPNTAAVIQNLQTLQAQGGLDTQDLQTAAAKLILQMQQGR